MRSPPRRSQGVHTWTRLHTPRIYRPLMIMQSTVVVTPRNGRRVNHTRQEVIQELLLQQVSALLIGLAEACPIYPISLRRPQRFPTPFPLHEAAPPMWYDHQFSNTCGFNFLNQNCRVAWFECGIRKHFAPAKSLSRPSVLFTAQFSGSMTQLNT